MLQKTFHLMSCHHTVIIMLLLLGFALPLTVSANDWITLQRAKPYRGITPEQAQQRRRAQILRYLQQQELNNENLQSVKEPPVPDSRFPESYRALADYYREQARQNERNNEE